MNITYRCPHCGDTQRAEVTAALTELTCSSCRNNLRVNPQAVDNGRLVKCLVCPSKELFVRKNFSQRLGVTIVVVGLGISCLTWYYRWILATYGVLFMTALVDVVLYLFVGELVECYVCHAQYRGLDTTEGHDSFNLETHERHRQLAARKKQQQPHAR